MDNLRGQEEISSEDSPDFGGIEAPPPISAQERRMHVRAYNYWVSLLGSRALPSIEDLNPEDMEDFSANSVLLDFSMGMDNPAVIYLGSALREECGIFGPIERIDQVPQRSLLTRLTDHYLQIIANAAPVGFEAEFTNQRGAEIMYRGILMPFSSDDQTIDFIYGVISWKEAASQQMSDALGEEMINAIGNTPVSYPATPIWADGPSATADFHDEDDDLPVARARHIDETEFGFEDISDEAASGTLDLTEQVADHQPASRFYAEIPLGRDPGDDAPAGAPEPAIDEDDVFDLLESLGPSDASLSTAAADASGAGVEELDLAAFMAEAEEQENVALSAIGEDPMEQQPDAWAEDAEAPADPEPLADLAEIDEEPLFLDTVTEPDESAPAPVGFAVVAPSTDMPDIGDVLDISEHDDDLAVLLDMARQGAGEVRDTDLRSRTALYRAIGLAYDFALSSRNAPEDYAHMLEQAGIAVQDRSPMTAIIKLVFGADYEKTRVAEYALALDYAFAEDLPRGALARQLGFYEGGLKGLVRDMRAARRTETATPESRAVRRLDRAMRRLSRAKPVDAAALPFGEEGLAVVVARREADGSISLVAGVDIDDKAAQKVVIAASKSI